MGEVLASINSPVRRQELAEDWLRFSKEAVATSWEFQKQWIELQKEYMRFQNQMEQFRLEIMRLQAEIERLQVEKLRLEKEKLELQREMAGRSVGMPAAPTKGQ